MEEILRYVTWEDADFVEMNVRLFDFQENNYAFWDFAERDVIEKYLSRCKQLEPEINNFPIGDIMRTNFRLNWRNLLTALDFVEGLRNEYEPLPLNDKDAPRVRDHTVQPCDGSWESQPRYYDEIPIKQAIREGKVIPQWGSAMKYLERVMPALQKVSDDCAEYSRIEKADRVEMKVSEFLEKRSGATLTALLLRDLKKTDKLVLLPDE